MYNIDEYVIHITGGICRIEDITSLNMSGADKNRTYYLLTPIKAYSSKAYVPTDNDSTIRKIITKEEALSLIDEIPSIPEMEIENEKQRENKYKEVLKSCDLRMLISVMKNLQNRKSKRLAEGKKNTATDDKYYKLAEESLYSELAFVLGKDKSEMQSLVFERIILE